MAQVEYQLHDTEFTQRGHSVDTAYKRSATPSWFGPDAGTLITAGLYHTHTHTRSLLKPKGLRLFGC